MNLKMVAKTVLHVVNKNSPVILLGVGVAMFAGCAVTAAQASVKAKDIIEDSELEKTLSGEEDAKLSGKEIVKKVGKYYIVPVALFAGGTACLIFSNRISTKRNAALAAACALSEDALKRYQTKIIEEIGEEKNADICERIAHDRVEEKLKTSTDEQAPFDVDKGYDISILEGNGTVPCVDAFTGKVFRTEVRFLKDAFERFIASIKRDPFGFVTINELYDELGISNIDMGDEYGWFYLDENDIPVTWEDFVSISSIIRDGDPVPYISFRYHEPPNDKFRNY